MITELKANPKMMMGVLGAGFLAILMSVTYFSYGSQISALEDEHAALSAELDDMDVTIAERQAAFDSDKKEAVAEVTGLRSELVELDQEAAVDFFDPAFNWKDWEQYEAARAHYKEALGADNAFTETYLPEDVVIDIGDGETLSFIDHEGLKVHMDELTVIPLTAEGDRVRYVGFVHYYNYLEEENLVNKDALDGSQAIVMFTASGDEHDRSVSEVQAWNGFSAASESNFESGSQDEL